jgi:hypothetical protein
VCVFVCASARAPRSFTGARGVLAAVNMSLDKRYTTISYKSLPTRLLVSLPLYYNIRYSVSGRARENKPTRNHNNNNLKRNEEAIVHENHVVESNHGTKSSMCMVGYAIVFLSCVCIYAWDVIIRDQPIRQNIRDPKQQSRRKHTTKKCLMQHEKNINII